jgi:hypothetical protein
MKLLIKFPTRTRPEKFFKTLDTYYANIIDHANTFFLISLDHDDISMNNENCIKLLKKYNNLDYCFGYNKSKIEACNADINNRDFDIILLASDDMIPIVYGFDNIIRSDMQKYFPNLNGSLWYNDGYQKENLNTLSILGKAYYDKFGYIYNPDYKSFYCDNEFTNIGIRDSSIVYINNIIIKHDHPDINPEVENDSLYVKNIKCLEEDRLTYIKRHNENFPVGKITDDNSRWTFGITTENLILTDDGLIDQSNTYVNKIIESINGMNIPKDKFELIIIGNNNQFKNITIDNIRIIYFDETIKNKWITKKKNMIFDLANYENCAVVHDYIIFDPTWYEGFLSFDTSWDVCMCQLRTIDDIRWRDWILGWDQEAPYRLSHKGVILWKNRLLYSDTNYTHTNMYVSGTVIIGKTDFLRRHKFNETLIWGQGEDDEWSRRCRPFWRYKMNTSATMRTIKQVDMN